MVLLLSFGKPVFYPVAFLRAFCIVKMLERTDQIAGNAADTLDWLICRFFAVAVWALVSNNAGIAADWVAVDRMVDRTVTDAGFFHAADELFKSVHVLERVTVQFHIGDVSAIGESMIRRFQADFIEGVDVKVDWNMEGVGVVVAVGDARNHTKIARGRF